MRISFLAAGLIGFIAATVFFMAYAFVMGIIALDEQRNLYGIFVAVGVCLAFAAAAVAHLLTTKKHQEGWPPRVKLAVEKSRDQEAPLEERAAKGATASASLERAA